MATKRHRVGKSRSVKGGDAYKIRYVGPDGSFRGVGTQVRLDTEHGTWVTELMGTVPKGEAIRQATTMYLRGEPGK